MLLDGAVANGTSVSRAEPAVDTGRVIVVEARQRLGHLPSGEILEANGARVGAPHPAATVFVFGAAVLVRWRASSYLGAARV